MNTSLKINSWYNIQEQKFEKYASKADLFDAGKLGILSMKKDIVEFGAYYSFYKNDKLVAKFYQDGTFGFCTQPYGIKLNNI